MSTVRAFSLVAVFLVAADGRVRDVTTRGSVGGADIGGTEVERCIVAAARTAVLPAFRREMFRVNYPFRL